MMRVSSRQRLVSWDSFDATLDDSNATATSLALLHSPSDLSVGCELYLANTIDGSTHDLYGDDTDEVNGGSTNLKRKRLMATVGIVDQGTMPQLDCDHPAVVTRDEAVVSTTAATTVEDTDWSDFPLDIQLGVLQFLDVESLRNVGAVHRSLRHLLVSTNESLEALWKPAVTRLWPWTRTLLSADCCSNDGSSCHTLLDAFDSGNFGVLLSMATADTPQQIDASLFVPTRWSRSLRTYRPYRRGGSHAASTELVLLPPTASLPGTVESTLSTTAADTTATALSTTVQFVGSVGVGDRCIRADAPLPRPQLLKGYFVDKQYHSPPPTVAGRTSLLERLRNSAYGSPILCGGATRQQAFKPFCAPFVDSNGHIILTPRLVSYYEVSILPKPAAEYSFEQQQQPRPSRGRHDRLVHNMNDRDAMAAMAEMAAATAAAPECVAVGLATSSFCLHSRMPGWDIHSYGYHGDDGGIFHAAGSMLKEYGAHFGVGDTVGCGVDYHRRAIFYTLNGTFLGYAFEGGKQSMTSTLLASSHHQQRDSFLFEDLYPVVGLDTNYPVSCNFGTERPFQFDLAGMIAQHETVVLQAMVHPQNHL